MDYTLTKNKIRYIILKHDPISLVICGCPNNEYDLEVDYIYNHLLNCETQLNIDELANDIYKIFIKCFHVDIVGNINIYINISQDLLKI